MKKGFTLIELLGVIIILSILTLLVVPNVVNSIKNSSHKNDELMKSMIISATKLYMSNSFPNMIVENGYVQCIPLSSLVENKYLEAPIKYENIDDATSIKAVKITYNTTNSYEIVDTSSCNTINTLMLQDQSNSNKSYFFNTDIRRDLIEEINIVDNISIPNGAIKVYDVSELQNNSIKLWYQDEDSNNLYEVYIGSEGSVLANSNSSKLFANLSSIKEIDLTNLDTSSVTNMSYMFQNCNSLTDINLGSIDTSNVKNMSHMFDGCSQVTTINANIIDTARLEDTTYMFSNTPNLSTLNITGSTFKSVNKYSNMFRSTKNGITIRINNGVDTNSVQTFITAALDNSGVVNYTIVR